MNASQNRIFSADNGLLPVVSTTPNVTKILAARRKPNVYIGVSNGNLRADWI